ncbi:MAG: DUF1122 domain-containing protein [Nitrospirae bacterium]|nr:MAG: DUF1122 domain-containing protein [Nitrospirota bacterium]
MSKEAIERLIKTLSKGIKVDDLKLFLQDLQRGRFIEERDYRLLAVKNNNRIHIAYIKCFFGRPPHYRPWIEVFSINPEVDFFRTSVSTELFELFAEALDWGESLFIEYAQDRETERMLELGKDVEATPLGKRLKELGFRWFKDWYFPEGAMEGGQKLQAQK